jgi:hypothetical protein
MTVDMRPADRAASSRIVVSTISRNEFLRRLTTAATVLVAIVTVLVASLISVSVALP